MDPKQIVADGYDRLHDVYADWTCAGHDGLRHLYIDKVLVRTGHEPRSGAGR